MQEEHAIADLCAALDVSRSGYHAWVARKPGPRAQADATLWPLIEQAYKESRQTYGSPRIRQWLGGHGPKCSRHRVARLMRSHRMRSQSKRRFRVQLTDSNHDSADCAQSSCAIWRCRPGATRSGWLTSPAWTRTKGWLYVAGVLDRHTRRCVGWAMDDTLATSLPLAALDMALKHRQPAVGLVHHSDRGVQYASAAYRQRLAAAGVQPSMSRRGNCYDNAAMESFWSSLKRELVHRVRFVTRAEARAAVFEWIEIVYNRERFHSALGYKSPVDFETQLN